MLEILLLIALTKKVGGVLEAKGRKGGWFKVLTVLLWFGGEILGGILGGVVGELSGYGLAVAYPLALLGAAAGALAAYGTARAAHPVEVIGPPPPPPVFG